MCANWRSTIDTLSHIVLIMSSKVSKLFASKLQQIRADRKLTQERLAFLCNIDRTYIGRLERMERSPSLDILQKIADGLGISLAELLTF